MKTDKLREKIKIWERETSLREKILIIILITILPVFIYYKIYFEERLERISTLVKEIKRLELETSRYEELIRKEKEIDQKLKEREKFLEEIKALFLSEEEIPELFREIALTIKRNKLELISFLPQTENERDYYKEILFEIHIKGHYRDIMSFLNNMTRMKKLVNISKLELTPLEREEKLLFRGTLVAYKYTGKPAEKQEKR